MKKTRLLVLVIGLALLASCRVKTSPAAISEAQLLQLLVELRPVDIVGAEKQRLGPEHDGGYVMIAGQDYDVLYSYGIGSDMGFESHFVAENRIRAYLYDHTIGGLPEEDPSPLITWKPEGTWSTPYCRSEFTAGPCGGKRPCGKGKPPFENGR